MPWPALEHGCLHDVARSGYVASAKALYDAPTTPVGASLRARVGPLSPALDAVLFAPLRAVTATDVATARAAMRPLAVWTPAGPHSDVVAALVLRVNVLATWAHDAQAAQAARERVDADDALDAFAYYAFAYLDAHLLAVLAVDTGDSLERRLAAAGAPHAGLHAGALPNLLRAIESAAGDLLGTKTPAADENASFAGVFEQLLPHRLAVRRFVAYIEQLAATTMPTARATLHALVAASFLGVYPHARTRPLFATRVRVYADFFTGDVGAAVERTFDFVTARTRGGDKFENQATIVAIVREYMLYAVATRLPHVATALRVRMAWDAYVTRACTAADAGRGALKATLLAGPVPSFAAPTLRADSTDARAYDFYRELLAAIDRYLVDDGGYDAPLDAVVTPAIEHIVRTLVRHCAEPTAIVATPLVPQNGADVRAYVGRSQVPLCVVYAQPELVRALEHARVQSSGLDVLVQMAARAGLFQVLLVRTFAAAVVERASLVAVPLPLGLVRAQAAELRRRMGIANTTPLPRGVLTTFVCRNCGTRRFTCAPETPDVKFRPTFVGARRVAFRACTRETRAVAELAAHGLPPYAALVAARRGPTLAEHDFDVAETLNRGGTTPPDPRLEPTALEAARAYLADADADFTIVDGPLPPRTRRRRNGGGDAHESDDEYDAFVRAWHALDDQPFVTTQPTTADDPAQTLTVACATKVYKNARHKLFARTTDDETSTKKRRRLLVAYVRARACCDTAATPVSLFGYALRHGDVVVVACTGCLAPTTHTSMTWYGAALLCATCAAARRASGSTHVTPRRTCHTCKDARAASSTHFFTRHVYDEKRAAFVEIAYCHLHATANAWFFASPLLYTLAEFTRHARSAVRNRMHWTPLGVGEPKAS